MANIFNIEAKSVRETADPLLQSFNVRDDVRNGTLLTGIKRPHNEKGTNCGPAKPLIYFGDLKFVRIRKGS